MALKPIFKHYFFMYDEFVKARVKLLQKRKEDEID